MEANEEVVEFIHEISSSQGENEYVALTRELLWIAPHPCQHLQLMLKGSTNPCRTFRVMAWPHSRTSTAPNVPSSSHRYWL